MYLEPTISNLQLTNCITTLSLLEKDNLSNFLLMFPCVLYGDEAVLVTKVTHKHTLPRGNYQIFILSTIFCSIALESVLIKTMAKSHSA